MKSRWARPLCLLLLGVLVPAKAVAQGTQSTPPQAEAGDPRSPAFEVGQNSPNPFSQTTTIPFTLGDSLQCKDSARKFSVTLRIYNVLAQLVAIPLLQSGEFAANQPVVNLALKCGNYTAFWNGLYLSTSQPVPAGVYLYRVEVNGRAVARKMVVVR